MSQLLLTLPVPWLLQKKMTAFHGACQTGKLGLVQSLLSIMGVSNVKQKAAVSCFHSLACSCVQVNLNLTA